MSTHNLLTTHRRLNSRKSSRGRGVNEEDNVVADRAKNPPPMPSARDVCVTTLDLGRQGQTLSIELGPVSSRSDMGTVDLVSDPHDCVPTILSLINRLQRARSSLDSGTLKNPLTPMSGCVRLSDLCCLPRRLSFATEKHCRSPALDRPTRRKFNSVHRCKQRNLILLLHIYLNLHAAARRVMPMSIYQLSCICENYMSGALLDVSVGRDSGIS